MVWPALCPGIAKGHHLNDQLSDQLAGILDRILDVTDELETVDREPYPTVKNVNACKASVDGLVADYRALRAQVPAEDVDDVERRFGRRMIRLRRRADQVLPGRTAGEKVATRVTENRWAPVGAAVPSNEFTSTEPASTKPASPSARERLQPKGPGVGREIDSWCGPCKDMKTHTIVAMVGEEVKQVLCETCGARHGFRESPARKSIDPSTTRTDKVKDRQRAERAQKEADQAAA